MTSLSKDLIGRTFEPFKLQVERGKIREFCLAIGESNPVFLDKAAAIAAGFNDTPAPPTFATTYTLWHYQLLDEIRKLGIDPGRVLHLKEQYDYVKPMYPGAPINATGRVEDVTVGKMETVTLHFDYRDDDGNLYMTGQISLFVRPENS
jgi:N-terminal half of MaoC dehydratase